MGEAVRRCDPAGRSYRELLQDEVAQTIDEHSSVDDELNRLLVALRS